MSSIFEPREAEKLDKSEQIARGDAAAALLGNHVLQAAFEEAERNILEKWRDGKTPEEREAQHAKIHAMDELRRVLEIFVDRGEHARELLRRAQ